MGARRAGRTMAVGTLVLQNSTAPASRNARAISASSSAGSPQHEMYPIVLSKPLTLTLSLSETGRPWSAPRGVPVFAYSASMARASSIAALNQTSVRQLTSCCARAARLQNAVTTASEVSSRATICSTSLVAGVSVINTSA